MKKVIVRFAGEVDPVVRRRAMQVGASVRAGGTKRFVLRGYVVLIVGKEQFNQATAIEIGVRCIALWGVSMIYEQNNSLQEQWRLPLRSRLRGGGRLPVSSHDPERPADDQRSGFPRTLGRLYQSFFRNKARSRQMNRSTTPASMDGVTAGMYAASAKIESARYGVSHAWVGGTVAAEVAGQNTIGIAPWLVRYRLIGASLQVTHWSNRGSWMIQVQDDWVSAALGPDLVFVGAAQRTDLTGEPANHPWIRIGSTPMPRLLPDSLEGGVGPTYAHLVTRESHLAYRQNCVPGVVAMEDGTALIAAPMFRMDDSLFTLHGSIAENGQPRSGYISARSLVYSAFYEVGAALVPAAGHPELVLLKFAPSEITDQENRNWWRGSVNADPDVRYVKRVRGSRDFVGLLPGGLVPDPAGFPIVGNLAPDWVGGVRVPLSAMPAWFAPGTVAARSAMFRQAIGTWAMGAAPDAYIPLIDSAQPLPAAFGAVYSTVIGDDVEYALSVKSLDNSLVPIGGSRRAVDDQSSAPVEALLAVAKTGLVFVRTSVSNPGSYTVTSAFHDVIGPADCGQFGAGMNPTVAFLPQVRYGCVLGGKRAYAVRAVRYERNPFLASALSMIGVNVSMPYTAGYLGRKNTSVGGPIFYTDREFGPYPDRAKYEELWFVVDGQKYVVDTRALGGNLEPITEAKYGNGILDLFRWFGSSINSQRRQQLGMFSLADDANYELLDFYADEYVCAGMEMATFAQVSDTDIMFVLHRRRFISTTRRYDAIVCRFSSTTGSAHVVATLLDDGNQQIGDFLALTCYQFEVTDAEGAVTQPPCLTLRRGRGDQAGQVLTSVDGGATWELLFDAASTCVVNSLGQQFGRQGTPSMGLHIIGPLGDSTADPRYPLKKPPAQE